MMRACGENLANIVSQCVEQILGVAARILQEEVRACSNRLPT